MLEFIICDDNQEFLRKVENIINKTMMKNERPYKIFKFNDYDQKFLKFISTKETERIYILDIEVPSMSGINMGRIIRKSDIQSPIIFLTGHEELGSLLLRKDVNFFAFINKFDEFEIRLKKNIEKSLATLNIKKFIEINDNRTYYRFSLENIIYITRDTAKRKTVIHTDSNSHKVNKTLTEITNMLDDRFVQTHRSCYVNKDRVIKIDYKKKEVIFDNGTIIDMISSNYKEAGDVNVT